MKKFALFLAAVVAIALLSMNAPSARAAGGVVFVGPRFVRTTVVRPVLPLYRPHVVLQTAALPVVVPVASNYVTEPVVLIPQQPYWGYVPTSLPVGTWTYVGR